MNDPGTRFLRYVIVDAIEEASSHELDIATRQVRHRPGKLRQEERSGLVLASVYPQEVRGAVEGGSPIDRWTDSYVSLVARSFELDDAPVPLMRWVREVPAGRECTEFKSTGSFAPKNIMIDVRKVARVYAEKVGAASGVVYRGLLEQLSGTDLGRALENPKIAVCSTERWGSTSLMVLDTLLVGETVDHVNKQGLTQAQEYLHLIKLRAEDRPKEAALYAAKMLESVFSKGRSYK